MNLCEFLELLGLSVEITATPFGRSLRSGVSSQPFEAKLEGVEINGKVVRAKGRTPGETIRSIVTQLNTTSTFEVDGEVRYMPRIKITDELWFTDVEIRTVT